MDMFQPPLLAPEHTITLDDINKRGFGEAVLGNLSPEEREANLIGKFMAQDLDMIRGREEQMCAQVLFDNGLSLRAYSDKYGSDIYEDYILKFYEGAGNPAAYSPPVSWADSSANRLEDIWEIVKILTGAGNRAIDLILGANAAGAILDDEKLIRLLDINNYNIGSIDPTVEYGGSVGRLGVINAVGYPLNLLTYNETYTDETSGQTVPFIDPDSIVLTAPEIGRTVYGAVVQLEVGSEGYNAYSMARVPKYTVDVFNDTKTYKTSSRPLPMVNRANPAVSAKVIF
jgi:hypothetical protein